MIYKEVMMSWFSHVSIIQEHTRLIWVSFQIDTALFYPGLAFLMEEVKTSENRLS